MMQFAFRVTSTPAMLLACLLVPACANDNPANPAAAPTPDAGADVHVQQDGETADVAPEGGSEDATVDVGEDAQGPEPVPVAKWARAFGGTNLEHAYDVVATSDGALVLGGFFATSISFGGVELQSAGGTDLFVARFDATGNHAWSHRFGGKGDQQLQRLSTLADGRIALTGSTAGFLQLGNDVVQVAEPGGSAALVAVLDSDGSPVWAKGFGELASGYDVVMTETGQLVVTGFFSSTIDFGCGQPLQSPGPWDMDGFVVVLDEAGGCVWNQRFGGQGTQMGRAVAVDAQGDILLAGNVDETMDLNGTVITSAGDTDLFVAKLAQGNGEVLWSARYGDVARQGVRDVAAVPDGSLVVTGVFDGVLDFGVGPLTNGGEALKEGDIYVAKLKSDGTAAWSRSFGGAGIQATFASAVEPDGDVLVTGGYENTLDFGCEPLTSVAWGDIFTVKLAADDGRCLWSLAWGGPVDEMGLAAAVLPGGELAVAGDLGSTVDFGTGPIGGFGGMDAFLLVLGNP